VKEKERDKKKKGGSPEKQHRLHPETKRSIWAVGFLGVGLILGLAGFGKAGPAGEAIHAALGALVGWGYFVLPLAALLVSGVLLFSDRQKIIGVTFFGAALLVLSALGLIDLFEPDRGGWLGLVLGSLEHPFGKTTAIIVVLVIFIIAILITLNIPIKLRREKKDDESEEDEEIPVVIAGEAAPAQKLEEKTPKEKDDDEMLEPDLEPEPPISIPVLSSKKKAHAPKFKDYVPPPLELLKSSTEKPTTGDLRANANIIKRTLESFGIAVEMGEINVGPKVTRYTLKPAEGTKVARITALNQDLALALAAHPIRIEAPIPGKSLVGIEVPNKAAAVVRLGSLMAYGEFQAAGQLGFALGRDVTGEPIFVNIEKMPHLLVAGATGSGKSVAIHALLISLLYKNSPATLRLAMIDPKRVELTIYQNIPHLVSPVVTETKKAVGVFRWALAEMDRRYELLEAAGSRDVKSYNANGGKDDPLPYIVIVVDELADLMATYGREIEGSIVRLAQMARATGIHLVLSTQRPSIEVITGLIKANITGRIALQVASQVDSRTILDAAGAEKLLGGGDLLLTTAELSKPRRIQGAYVSEEEINAVADFIREHNLGSIEEAKEDQVAFENGEGSAKPTNEVSFDDYAEGGSDDELYEAAVQVVAEAQKASTSLLQRRLKLGYARAARLVDLLEERGIVGPGDGAKPREVFVEKPAPE
jgi:S-DNA-T family DNA segregation ATPase FtsK/SpoIIIE